MPAISLDLGDAQELREALEALSAICGERHLRVNARQLRAAVVVLRRLKAVPTDPQGLGVAPGGPARLEDRLRRGMTCLRLGSQHAGFQMRLLVAVPG